MMIHRCSDNGWRNGRLALVHANEGKCKECWLFITVIIGMGITGSQPQGLVLPFIWGYTQAKVTWKINIPTKQTCVNKNSPKGS